MLTFGNLPLLANHQEFVTGLSLLIIGLALAALTGFLIWNHKKMVSRRSFDRLNRDNSWWRFVVKNFPLFLLLFFIIMAITGLAMII